MEFMDRRSCDDFGFVHLDLLVFGIFLMGKEKYVEYFKNICEYCQKY